MICLWDDEWLEAILMRLIICLTNYVTVRNYKVNKFILSNESGTVKQKAFIHKLNAAMHFIYSNCVHVLFIE